MWIPEKKEEGKHKLDDNFWCMGCSTSFATFSPYLAILWIFLDPCASEFHDLAVRALSVEIIVQWYSNQFYQQSFSLFPTGSTSNALARTWKCLHHLAFVHVFLISRRKLQQVSIEFNRISMVHWPAKQRSPSWENRKYRLPKELHPVSKK